MEYGRAPIYRPPPRGRIADVAGVEVASIRKTWRGFRQVTVTNPVASAGKTAAALMLALTFAQTRTDRILLWPVDTGEIRGLPDIGFDVLPPEELPTAEAFRRRRAAVARGYDLVIVDTGEDTHAPAWLAALDATDQLVIPVSDEPDSVRAAAWLLDGLEQTGRGALVRRSVAVLPSTPPAAPVPPDLDRCRTVLRVPHDRHLEAGGSFEPAGVSAASRAAWLLVGAAVATGL
jgi:hypothetical protein